MDKNKWVMYLVNSVTFIGFLAIGIFIAILYHRGIFSSTVSFQHYIDGYGPFAPLVFMLIQIVQVVFPFLPGGISTVAGVVIFGAWRGFLYNYFSICLGSILVFILSRKYGSDFVKNIIKEKNYNKYSQWINKGRRFERFFASAIFFPGFPDDVLCYMAGLTKMRLGRFIAIILLGKPLSIAVYSMGIAAIIQFLQRLF